MVEKDVNITYETLFDLLRREKTRAELQELDKKFFEDVVGYLNEKNKVLVEQKSKIDLFSSTEKEKTEKQIENIKKILKETYEKRESKIIDMALNKSRVPSIIVDNSVLLEEETRLFEQLVELMDDHRKGILLRVLEGELPLLEEKKASGAIPEKEPKKEQDIEKRKTEKNNKIVRFKNAVPSFVGTELEEYGPFEEDEIANLPSEIASLLVEKGRAEFTDEKE